jgi:hypothetical protein
MCLTENVDSNWEEKSGIVDEMIESYHVRQEKGKEV